MRGGPSLSLLSIRLLSVVHVVSIVQRERSDRKRNERTFASKKSGIEARISLSLSLSLSHRRPYRRLSFPRVVVSHDDQWRRRERNRGESLLKRRFVKNTRQRRTKCDHHLWNLSREIHVRFLALFQTLFEDLVIDERVVLMLRLLLLFYEYRARMIVVEHIICFYVCES